MATLLLVATPHVEFGKLLRDSLQDSGLYQVRLVHSADETRQAVKNATFHLALLDSAIANDAFVILCEEVLSIQAGIRLIIIPPANNPKHPALGSFTPHGYLNRPFYLPDLIDTVALLLEQREHELKNPSADLPFLPTWLQEPLVLNTYLEQELSNMDALAAVVGQSGLEQGKDPVRGYTGEVNEAEASELATVVFRYWNREEKTDVMRFLRISNDKKEYLAYAAHVAGDLVLILAYEAGTPLSRVRPKTKAFAQLLATQPPETSPAGFIPRKSTAPLAAPQNEKAPEDDFPPETRLDENTNYSLGTSTHAHVGFHWAEEESDETEASRPINLSELLGGSVPPPDPYNPRDGGWAADIPVRQPGPSSNVFNGWMPAGFEKTPDNLPGESSPVIQLPSQMPETWGPAESKNGVSSSQPLEQHDGDDVLAEMRRMQAALANAAASNQESSREEQADSGDPFDKDSSQPQPEPAADAFAGDSSWSGFPSSAANKADSSFDFVRSDPDGDDEAEAIFNHPLPDWLMRYSSEESAPTVESGAGEEAKEQQSPLPEASAVESGPACAEVPTEPIPSAAQESETTRALQRVPEIHDLEDTRPRVVSTLTKISQLEPSSPAVSLLNYSCVLVPRLPQHYLTGSLADLLAAWVQQSCIAFGWRLEGISIRPEYLLWSVQLTPFVSPGNLVKIMRQRTSNQIFQTFSHLQEQNPSGDFWATGYLVVSGAQPPSPQLVREFITQTRQRQGIIK